MPDPHELFDSRVTLHHHPAFHGQLKSASVQEVDERRLPRCSSGVGWGWDGVEIGVGWGGVGWGAVD